MTDNELKQIKMFVLDELRTLYTKPTVNLWFEPMKVVSLNTETVTVSLPQSRKTFVETQYYDILKAKFSEILGFNAELVLISDEEEAELPEEEEEEIKPKSAYKIRFNPEYTFENFVVGKSNQLAQSASLAVAKHPAELNNPLFLYGPSGLGKTHLLFAIVNEIRKNHPDYNILYVTGEEFTNELIESLSMKKPMVFREKYRNLDVLLVDDIQFIAGKLSVQEEFFHTFDTLFKMNKQIILASDCAPKDIDNLEDRLKSRFVMGLVADIQPPDLELRVAIFKRKAMDFGYDLELEILYYLAKNITTNIRQIEGALKKLKAHTLITGQVCDYYVAKEVLSEFFVNAKSEESIIDRIFAFAEKRYGISREEMKSSKRNADIIAARHYAIYLIRKTTNLSQNSIAKLFNKKDHTTVINSIAFIERKMKNEPGFERELLSAIAELRS
ncbi:MAG: chromosomal replication initiator protein DnaA [Clostridia bacterium]|nr:chromosomal replication initiator protein DnaA [Clostridia bacterium]MBQ9848626.1 chromosomal replication initiator protein DnaA [Clostridia bacterium]